MLNLQYPENIQINGNGYDIMVRPYITVEEKNIIINEMLKEKNPLDREAKLDSFLLKFCVPSENFVGMDYDLIKSTGLMADVHNVLISDIVEIERCIEKSESVQANVNIFLEELIKLMDKTMKNAFTKEQINTLFASLEELKKIK